MSEHQFKGIYWIGYGDAMAESRRKRRTMSLSILLTIVTVAILAFWAGRASMRSRVALAYEAGFDAGVTEGTTKWGEWK